MKVIVAIPIWGEGYVDRFLRYALPSLRQPGNLPAIMAAGHELEVVFYTCNEDAQRLQQDMPVTGLPHRYETFGWRYEPFFAHCHGGTMMKDLFQKGFDLAWGQQAAFVPVCADAVYSDGFFASALDIVTTKGYRAAMTQGSGVNVETIGPHLEAMTRGGVMNAPPREMMRVFLRATRYGLDLPTWPGTQLYPAQFFSPAGEHAAVMRCCHMYVAMIRAHRHAVMQYCPDNDLAEKVLNAPSDIGWMDDSDLGFFFGLAVPLHPSLEPACPQGSQNVSPEQALVDFCSRWVTPWKAGYYGQRVLWHDGLAGGTSALADAVRASDEVVDHILSVYRAGGGRVLS